MPEIKQAPPKYMQIADYIRDRITRGELQPGDEVPSERQLAAEWKVARPTVTKALDVLRREGHLGSRQGAGTYVLGPSRFHRGANMAYVRSAETGRIYPAGQRAEILLAEQVVAPQHVALALELEPNAGVVRRQRVTLRNREPVELSTSWFDAQLADEAPRILTTERILEGTVAYVEAQSGRRARAARDRISARLATASERELLGLTDPSAVLVTRHVVLDADTRPLEFAESVVPPEAWTVEHEYFIGP
jgi:DNA-binding GntR family transcriptional regulator